MKAEKYFKKEYGDDISDSATIKLKHGSLEITMNEIYTVMQEFAEQYSKAQLVEFYKWLLVEPTSEEESLEQVEQFLKEKE